MAKIGNKKNNKKARKEKLSIYLVHPQITSDAEIVKLESSKNPIKITINETESSTLYIKREPPLKRPPWTQLFTETGQVNEDHFGNSSSVGAVYIVRAYGSTFVLSFGTGFHLIKDNAIERDFGLRITLNSVDPDKLRSLDKASYDHNPLNSRTQSTREVDISNLHLDYEMEILYAITGASQESLFGTHVTGRDSFTIAIEINLNSLHTILKRCIQKYKEKLPDQFKWVDNINRVKTSADIEILDLELEKRLQNGETSGFWLGEPEIVDWETQLAYSFDTLNNSPRHTVLQLENYMDYLKSENKDISILSIREDCVHINSPEYKSIKKWSIYRCLYAEILYGNETYILRNGTWYKINNDFIKTINSYLTPPNLEPYDFNLPEFNHEKEGYYNDFVASQHKNIFKLDAKNIPIGAPHDKIEHCDLLKDKTEFIHVKCYRSSSTLSHLFSQGLVSAQSFVKDSTYREKLNKKLPSDLRLANTKERPNTHNYKVVYAIATTKNIPEDLPFFSKVTLKNATETLRSMGYGVFLAKIGISHNIRVTKKIKPRKTKG